MKLSNDEKIILINLLQHEIEWAEDEICNTHDRELEKYFNKLENLIIKLKNNL